MLQFSRLLEAELGRAGHDVRVVRPDARLGRLARTPRGFGKWLGYLDKFVLFPLRLREAVASADIVQICDQAYSIYTRQLKSTPNVATCHDLISVRSALGEFAGVRTRWSGKKYQRMIVDGLTRADHVACDSEATKYPGETLLHVTAVLSVSRGFYSTESPTSTTVPE